MAEEVELKLELDVDGADAVAGSALLGEAGAEVQQRSIYFDTPDGLLARAGLSLRIRRSGRRRIQTVKAQGRSAAGLFARPEWERSVRNDTPLLDDTTPVKAVLGEAVEALRPAFEVHMNRQKWIIREGSALIEMVLDRGEVRSADRLSTVCEIELELKQGDPATLFAFARKLDAIAPIRLGVLTKAQRGYALAGPSVTTFKADPVRLDLDMTAAEAFRHIAQSCIRQFRLNEPHILDGYGADALHQARVALRRLRSAFAIFKAMLDGETGNRLREQLRWLASELGDARNLDVLLERSEAGPLQEALKLARAEAYGRAEEALASARARALTLDLTEWIVSGEWLAAPDTAAVREQPARDFAAAALERFRRKVKKSGRNLAGIDDEGRHTDRKDAKKLRYAAEYFHSLFDGKGERRRYKRFIAALEALQDQLGLLNDLATAPEVLRKFDLSDRQGASQLLGDGKKKPLIKAAQKAHDRLMEAERFWE